MLIDFHTHIFPDRIAPGALQQLLNNTRIYQEIYGEAQPHTDATANGLSVSSKAAGLDISLVLPIATSPKPSPTINDFAAQVDKLPGLRSFGSVHPRNLEFLQELERLHSLGLRGIKLHPEYQGFFVDDPEGVAVVRAAARLGLWVVFHAGADIGMPPPIHCTPERVIRLRKAVPDAKIVLAHLGGFQLWEKVLPCLPEMDVMLDTSYSLQVREQWDLFAAIIRRNGASKVLFGTDSPWADQAAAAEDMRSFLDAYGFTEAEKAAVMGGNAARILNE